MGDRGTDNSGSVKTVIFYRESLMITRTQVMFHTGKLQSTLQNQATRKKGDRKEKSSSGNK
jgi:hypothetical protein